MKASSLLHTDVIGIYVGIIGIVVAYIFYVRAKEQIKPRILIEDTILIGKTERLFPESVEIRYDGRVVSSLSKIRITFWNAGRKTLNYSDVAKHDPIVATFWETQVLDVRSITATREVIDAQTALENDKIKISFDFLDRGDGLAFEVFCTKDEFTAYVSLDGTIKGVHNGISVVNDDHSLLHRDPELNSLIPGILLTVISAGFIEQILTSSKVDYVTVISAVIFGVTGLSVTVQNIYGYLYGRIPRKLRRNLPDGS